MPYIGTSPSQGVRRVHTYTATANQTSFSGAGAEGATLSYKDSNFVDVYQNGVKLGDADYTATSGTAIVLGTGATVSDLVVIVAYDVFSAADTVSKADGGQFDNAVTISTADNNAQLTLTSTDADASSGPQLDLYRNSASPADSDVFGRIRFLGENDADEQIAYATIFTKAVDVSDGTEDANLRIDSIVGGTNTQRLEFNHDAAVFNEGSANIDFRIESNDDANMFFLDASANAIGIRTSTDHGGQLNIETTGQAYNVVLACTDDDANHGPLLDFKRISSSPADNDLLGEISFRGRNDNTEDITYATITGKIKDATDGTEDGNLHFNLMIAGTSREAFTITKDSVVVNQDSVNLDFRVESNSNDRSFVVDGSDGIIQMGTSHTNVTTTDGRHGIVMNDKTTGFYLGVIQASANGNASLILNRDSDDGSIVLFCQDADIEGTISSSGSTISYNSFSGSHWSRLSDNSKPTILKGTVIETIDEMCDWYQAKFTVADEENGKIFNRTTKNYIELPKGKSIGDTITHTFEGKEYTAEIIKEPNNKHTKCKISDTADSKRVYGVFADWDNDDDTVNDMYVTAVGTHVVRINKDVTVTAGDLLSSNGDGTAKVQDDDIIRSKTIGKVLTNIKQETYSDGSYTVPCALYCG